MNPFWQTILAAFSTNILFLFVNMYFVHWRKRDEAPCDLQKQITIMRGQIKYIEGRLNGKHWKTEA